MTTEQLETLRAWIRESRRAVFFGGAGVSTESGIPDFRSVDGLYSQHYDASPEEILSRSFFDRDPDTFFRFCREKLVTEGAKPNVTHLRLASLEQEGKLAAVVTQNIDGLHQLAGSRTVYELHGSLLRSYCVRCGRRYTGFAHLKRAPGVPRCPCGGVIRPDIVLYEEPLDEAVTRGAAEAIARADLLLVGGTSLAVYPAAGLLRYYGGHRLALINRSPTPWDDSADLLLPERLGSVFAQV